MTEKNRHYMIFGDMTSAKSSENCPETTLCRECARRAEIVTDFGESDEPCDEC